MVYYQYNHYLIIVIIISVIMMIMAHIVNILPFLSLATLWATVIAATRRGCVTAITRGLISNSTPSTTELSNPPVSTVSSAFLPPSIECTE